MIERSCQRLDPGSIPGRRTNYVGTFLFCALVHLVRDRERREGLQPFYL
jgi:hypothetical protein